MCGRYTFTSTPDPALVVYPEGESIALIPRYNIAPSQFCAVIPQHDPSRVHYYRWGLVPFWAKDIKIGYKMINARAETLLSKAAFKNPVKNKRCLIPADGFYEWKSTTSGKQPYRIMLKDESVFHFAGLYDTWQKPDGNTLYSFTIITTEPNEITMDIHDRMPVILDAENSQKWISDLAVEELLPILRPYNAAEMKTYPVSPSVGNVRNDHGSLIMPYEPPPSLF